MKSAAFAGVLRETCTVVALSIIPPGYGSGIRAFGVYVAKLKVPVGTHWDISWKEENETC